MLRWIREDVANTLLNTKFCCGWFEGQEGCNCICCKPISGKQKYFNFLYHSDCDGGFISVDSKQKKKFNDYWSLRMLKKEIQEIDNLMKRADFVNLRIYNAWVDFRDDVMSARKILHFR